MEILYCSLALSHQYDILMNFFNWFSLYKMVSKCHLPACAMFVSAWARESNSAQVSAWYLPSCWGVPHSPQLAPIAAECTAFMEDPAQTTHTQDTAQHSNTHYIPNNIIQFDCALFCCGYINGLVQERRNSIANALELRLSCTNPSISCFSGPVQCWKFPQVRQSEADNFGGGPGSFYWYFFSFMFMT